MAEADVDIASLTELFENKDEDYLYEMIAKYDPDLIYALPQDAAHLVEAGRKWFGQRSEEIKRFVCPKVPDNVSKPISDELMIVLFGYFDTEHGKAFAAFATALVLKKIVQGWCRNYNPVGDT